MSLQVMGDSKEKHAWATKYRRGNIVLYRFCLLTHAQVDVNNAESIIHFAA